MNFAQSLQLLESLSKKSIVLDQLLFLLFLKYVEEVELRTEVLQRCQAKLVSALGPMIDDTLRFAGEPALTKPLVDGALVRMLADDFGDAECALLRQYRGQG